MDAIRKHRPTVALVLSGGGAKGAAHIGAIDFIERLGIPVDMVLGTSMGGLIGSLYALGYNSHQMDSLIRSLDWGELLSDNIPSSFRTYQQKRYRETYLFSVPFYYSQHAIFTKEKDNNAKNESNQLLDAVLNTKTDPGHIHIGANDEMAEKTLKDNLFGSLPSGFINGQNVNNLISSLTVGYQDEIDFSECRSSALRAIWLQARPNSGIPASLQRHCALLCPFRAFLLLLEWTGWCLWTEVSGTTIPPM